MKLQNFAEFIKESNQIADIFQSLHGAIDFSSLIPLDDSKFKFSDEEVEDAVDYLEIDRKDLYYVPGDMFHPIIYLDGPNFHQFMGGDMRIETLKLMQTKERLKRKREYFEKAIQNKRYEDLYRRLDKKILIPYFILNYKDIPEKQMYDIFIDLYIKSEFGFDALSDEIIDDIIKASAYSEERKKSIELLKKKFGDSKFKIYRGEGSKSTKKGLSWTLDKKTAKFFANRFGQTGKILEKEITVDDVLDYIESRNEKEILLKNTQN